MKAREVAQRADVELLAVLAELDVPEVVAARLIAEARRSREAGAEYQKRTWGWIRFSEEIWPAMRREYIGGAQKRAVERFLSQRRRMFGGRITVIGPDPSVAEASPGERLATAREAGEAAAKEWDKRDPQAAFEAWFAKQP